MLCSNREIQGCLRKNLSSAFSDNNSNIWLAIGDFDNLKNVNTLYGKALVDVLLNLSYNILRAVIDEFCHKYQMREAVHSFSGDELILILPTFSSDRKEIEMFLNRMRKQIESHFRCGYFVACIIDFERVVSQLEPSRIFEIRNILAKNEIYIDIISRRKGHLFVSPLKFSGEDVHAALKRVMCTINRVLEKESGQKVQGCLDWLYNIQEQSYECFNNGYVWPITMSFGAVSHREIIEKLRIAPLSGLTDYEIELIMKEMFLNAQAGTRESKKRGNTITLGVVSKSFFSSCTKEEVMGPFRFTITKSYNHSRTKNCITGEHHLREAVYQLCRCDSQGFLLFVEPFYSLVSVKIDLPGNRILKTMGLKDLNDTYGYDVGDKIIFLMESLIIQAVRKYCSSHRLSRKNILISRFVDTFKIYFFSTTLSRRLLTKMMKALINDFNTLSDRVKIVRLSVSVVPNREKISGNILFKRLDYTIISEVSPGILAEDGPLLIKEYIPGVEEEGEGKIEREAYQSAYALKNM